VDPQSLDDNYRLWFSFPWYRIYTLNIDTLPAAAARTFALPRDLEIVSGLSDPAPLAESSKLQVIHLNGTLDDLPNATFSTAQYARRLAAPDLWYENFVRELQLHPIIYVGTQLDEPSLWTYIEARGEKPKREFRPGSYLISPSLGRARSVALSGYNITNIAATGVDFASEILAPLESDAQQGARTITERLDSDHQGRILLPLLDIMEDSRNDEREFLLGREPRWSDITHGFAFERECDRDLATQAAEQSPRTLLVTGTAGSGKTTTAMRFVLDQAASGRDVAVLNPDSKVPFHALIGAVRAAEPRILFIDNLDRFGRATADLLADLNEATTDIMVVGCIRSSRLEGLGDLMPSEDEGMEFSVPHLGEGDVDELLSALDRANRLGALKGLTGSERRRSVEQRFGRQLLVALIEITSNVRFNEKVDSECRDLEGEAARAYAAAALATSLNTGLRDEELVIATRADEPATAMEAIDRLLGRHLLVRADTNRIGVRHSVIASRAVTYFREAGALQPVLTALLFGLASTARLDDLRSTPSGRLVIRLINHDYLMRLLYRRLDDDADRAAVRAVYDAIERPFAGDYHYWLQRGSFETEDGNLDQARNFLEQALSMAPNDFFVRTEWSYMTLKRASWNPDEPSAPDDAARAFRELEEVILHRGKRDPHPFHVYGSQGLGWAHRGPLGPDEQKRLLEKLRKVVDDGLDLHPAMEDLKKLKRDLNREYMMLATR
jgi:tetratricopeptide (TPR) repeat protein